MNVNGIEYTFKDGVWTTEDDQILKSSSVNKKDGTLRAKYKDLPRYKLIPIMEDHFVNEFNKTINQISKEVLKYISKKI